MYERVIIVTPIVPLFQPESLQPVTQILYANGVQNEDSENEADNHDAPP